MSRVALALSIVLAAFTPSVVAQNAAEPALTDPSGDAVWLTSADAGGYAFQACNLGGQPTSRACANAPPLPTAGGAPAPAVLDLVSADLWVRDGVLVGEFRVASLNDPISALAAGDESISYQLSWDVGDAVARDGFGVQIYRINGSLQTDAWFARADDACAQVVTCYFEPTFELIPGTPGTIRWSVSASALPPDTPAEATLSGTALHTTLATKGALTSYNYAAAARDRNAIGWTPGWTYSVVDVAGPGRPTPLGPFSWDPARDRILGHDDPVGDLPAQRADLDILHVEVAEDEKTFRVSTTLARVDELPQDHVFVVDLAPTTGASITAGYIATAGARATYSGLCDPCGPWTRAPLTRPADIQVVAGEPGYVNITFSRNDLGDPARGDAFNVFYVGAMLPEAIDHRDVAGAGAVDKFDNTLGDFAYDLQPWWFVEGGVRTTLRDDDAVEVTDPVADYTSAPSLAGLTADLAPFDINSIRAVGESPGIFRVELGIEDLSDVEPPEGYKAIFYGVAFATEQGPIMVGYYDEPAEKKSQFFCAPDTAVLTQPAGDPNKVIWQPIAGLLSVVRDRGEQIAGSATPGSIVFLVPSSCFGLAPESDLEAETLAAATFLFDSALGDMQAIDTAASDGPVVVSAGSVAAPPFYVEPFGIAEFWNIAGIVGAVIVSAIGALIALKKRGALRRYLHEIEGVLVEHAADGRAREKALYSIQARLKADLLKGRILEAHFVIVERRLDQHLAKVRVQALGDAFGDLPHRLLLTLQDLLRDGAMEPEDWKLFRSQLDAEPHLTRDSRASIEQRVQAWVREERALTTGTR